MTQTSMQEIRVILNQCGATLELHRTGKEPVMLAMFKPDHIAQYGKKLSANNPDMRYASIGQLALQMAREIARGDCAVSPHTWTYNASTNEYSPA